MTKKKPPLQGVKNKDSMTSLSSITIPREPLRHTCLLLHAQRVTRLESARHRKLESKLLVVQTKVLQQNFQISLAPLWNTTGLSTLTERQHQKLLVCQTTGSTTVVIVLIHKEESLLLFNSNRVLVLELAIRLIRSAERVEGESDVALQSLVRVTGQQVGDAEKEVNASGGENSLADLPHLEPQNVAAVPSQAALPMPKEKTDTQTNRSAQPDVAQAQPPQGEVEQAGLSGVASPQPLQPAQLAQREAEQDLSGVASPSQPETRPSISGFVETRSNLVTQSVEQSIAPVQFPQEQAGLSGVASAQPLVPEMQPSTPLSNIPLERAHPNRGQSSRQPEAAAGSAQPAQLFPAPSMMFNHPPIGDEPLKNELHRLRLHIDSLDKIYELKQSQLQTECSQEIEKIKQKYDLLLEEQDSVHLEQMKTLDGLLEKVVFHQSLAADFRAKFISPSAAQAKAYSRPIHQTPQASQQAPMRPPGMTSTSPPAAWSSAGRPVVPGGAQPSQVDRPSTPASSQAPRPPLPSTPVVRLPINPGNLVRTTGAPMPRVPPRGSHGVPSAPAPHLQCRLPPRAHSTAPANQRQQQHATSVSPQSSHAVPPVSSSPLPPSSSQATHHGSSTRMDVDVVCLSDDE
uniref:Uncharacterized protein n=1 Tax=Aegilops tauschii subsp. strangulata TaxID=200361 RepID=A0A453JZE0_AEGTS